VVNKHLHEVHGLSVTASAAGNADPSCNYGRLYIHTVHTKKILYNANKSNCF